MPNGMRVYAPAKLNIHLRVYPVREDGYHRIESIFQQISLYDELYVEIDEKMLTGNCCALVTDNIDLPPVNTVTKAYNLFCEFTGIRQSVSVHLTKRIPCGAGMGGGSSDGAAMLRALNELFGTEISILQLHDLAEKIGSDVPFFLYGKSALVEGRGECIKRLVARNDIYFVLVCPEVHSSTKEAYHLIDEWYYTSSTRVNWPVAAELASMYGKPVAEWRFANSFTPPLANAFPVIGSALEDIRSSGAQFFNMTGSGSTVFGVFSSADEAETACLQLGRKWKRCYCVSAS